MAKNFGQMLSSLSNWAREPVDDDIARDALNDGIEAIWCKVLEAQVDEMVGGPASITLASASERFQLVSIADPLVAPTVVDFAGGALAAHTPFVAYSIVTDSGSETLMSPVQSVHQVAQNNVARVQSPARVPVAYGWNLYAGSSLANMCRQNAAPLVFGQDFFEPITGFLDAGGQDQSVGQLPPTENTTADDIFYIRLLEVPLPSGGFKRWEQVTIDSEFFRQASRMVATSGDYNPYYYDLINGRTLEFRPALGQAFSPRYFFVHKPRRIMFDNATIPFYTFPWEEALRSYALSAWFATQDDDAAVQKWEGRGDTALMRSCAVLVQKSWDKDITITPYIAR